MNPEKRTILPGLAFRSFASRYQQPELTEGFQDIILWEFRVRFPAHGFYTKTLIEGRVCSLRELKQNVKYGPSIGPEFYDWGSSSTLLSLIVCHLGAMLKKLHYLLEEHLWLLSCAIELYLVKITMQSLSILWCIQLKILWCLCIFLLLCGSNLY